MKIAEHADRTEQLVGLRAEDIHRWIDGFFDVESFDDFLRRGPGQGFDPYKHRKYRHCAEALETAFREFEGTYTREQIKAVFERHVRDDYDGLIPLQEDFESGAFTEKYHEGEDREELEAILSEAELAEYFRGKASPRGSADPRKLSAGFYGRIVWPTVIAAILFAASAFTIIIPLFRNSMLKQKREMIKELTTTAASVIEFYIGREQRGELSREAAQQGAAEAVSSLRYGIDHKDYFWITDMHPRMVMHPYRTELVGMDLTDYTDREDKSGKVLFVEFVDLVKANREGYLEYLWQWMDDPSRAEPKLSYVQGVPAWDWVIGTGIYIHDIEEELRGLTRNLLIADGIIALLLLALMANLVYQSRRIEIDRKQAETGLREAKDRYRALVEGSREGTVLVIDGQTVYSNHTMRRMTGYTEAELADRHVGELLEPDCAVNAAAEAHLKELIEHTAASDEFEARIRTRQGASLDVRLTTSRIFFSEKNGHVISFGEIRGGPTHTLKAFYQADDPRSLADTALQQQVAEGQTAGQVIQALKQLPERIRGMTDQGVRPGILRETVGCTYDAAIQRFVTLALEETGEAPVPFAFLSLGSNARHEMTMFSDQDNALIFADVGEENVAELRRRFLALADEVCGKLNQAGYPYCPGGIMAVNPKWCQPLSAWKTYFDRWILQASPQSILEVNVFFDVRCAHGDDGLVGALREHIQARTRQNQEFYIHYAKNCLGYKAPLGMLGKIRTEKRGTERTINLKECIKPLETFARIYALKHDVVMPGTLERLQALHEAEVIQEETYRELVYVFNYLWQLRFFNQIVTNAALSTDTDELDIERLNDIERDNLQSVLARIPVFQTKLSYDFLGVASL